MLENGDAERAYASGVTFSVDVASGIRGHYLLILHRLDPEDFEQIRAEYYSLDFEAYDMAPCAQYGRGDINLQETDFQTCTALARSNATCRKEKDRAGAWACVGGGGVAVISCLFPANPICWGSLVFTAACDICMGLEAKNALADFNNAKNCCCVGLICRTDGGSQCPTNSECNSSGCPNPVVCGL